METTAYPAIFLAVYIIKIVKQRNWRIKS